MKRWHFVHDVNWRQWGIGFEIGPRDFYSIWLGPFVFDFYKVD